MSKNPLYKKTSSSKLITSNVGSSPDTSLGAYVSRDISGEEPPLEVINSYFEVSRVSKTYLDRLCLNTSVTVYNLYTYLQLCPIWWLCELGF